jgi:uncharacterized protein
MRKSLGIFLILVCGVAHAASFDCAKAQTAQEKAICSSPQLSAEDEKLAAIYKASLESISPNTVKGLRADQAQWLRYVATVCEAAKKQPQDKLAHCMLNNYAKREELLSRSRQQHGDVYIVKRTSMQAAHHGQNSHWDEYASAVDAFGKKLFEWPQADSDASEWKVWNTKVEQETLNMCNEGLSAKGFIDVADYDPADIIADTTATVVHVEQNRVSVNIASKFTVQPQDGMFDSEEKRESLHWLIKEQREMKADDTFRPDSEWVKAVKDFCKEAIAKDFANKPELESFRFTTKRYDRFIQNPRNWEFSSEGLTINVNLDLLRGSTDTEDTDTDSGTFDAVSSEYNPVTISWGTLKPFLQTGFVIPK